MAAIRFAAILAGGLAFLAGAASADEVRTYESSDPALKLGMVEFPGGKTLDLSVGIGSALFHMPGDPADVLYGLTDRGPNIDCSASGSLGFGGHNGVVVMRKYKA